MMSDLIQRLRDAAWAGPVPCPVCDEAADAIENMHAAYGHSQQQFLDAAATIERLTAERDAARREGMRAAASILDAEHDKRKHIDNHAAYYARLIRESIG
jgi:hypothetical protein